MRTDNHKTGAKSREMREIEAYAQTLAAGEPGDEELLIPAHTIERYRRAYRTKKLPVDLLFRLLGPLAGKTVLDCGCGDGEFSVIMALLGARVVGVDIGEKLLVRAARRAQVNGVTGMVDFVTASLHELPFPAGSFDLAFGKGVIHHVDPSLAGAEIMRVIRQGGRGVFEEPAALSALLRRARKSRFITGIFPEDRITPDEEPLGKAEIDLFARPYRSCHVHHLQLFSRLERIVGAGRFYHALNRADAVLLRIFPMFRRFCRLVILEVTK